MFVSEPSATTARIALVLAAVLWSSGSLFMRLLQVESVFGLNEPSLSAIQIAFYRALFAGLALVVLLRRSHCRFRPAMGVTVLIFATMTALYVSALAHGSAANAILLQNTSPVWVCLLGLWLLGEVADRRTLSAILIGLLGAVVIVVGNWPRGTDQSAADQARVLLMGIGSGITYAGVVLMLRKLRNESAVWLTILNLLGSAAMIALIVFIRSGGNDFIEWLTAPSAKQLLFLAVYGVVQLAIPYLLFSWSLKTVSSNEASIITLLEPVLNPIWAYLIAPSREVPTIWTWLGGTLLLAALVWRYAPNPRPQTQP
jgi:drug/metabolite transporter, DME family